MKVRESYYQEGFKGDLTIAELIQYGYSDVGDTEEIILKRLERHRYILAAIIEKVHLSDSEILRLTGNEFRLELDE